MKTPTVALGVDAVRELKSLTSTVVANGSCRRGCSRGCRRGCRVSCRRGCRRACRR